MIKRLSSIVAVAVAVALGATSCTAPRSVPSASANQLASVVEIPDSPLGEVTTWALAIIQGETDVTVTDIEERFAPEAIAQIGTPADLVAAFESLQTLAPYKVLEYQKRGATAGTRVEAGGNAYMLSVSLDDAGLLTSFAVQAAPEIPEPAANWDELTERIEEIGAPVAVSVFDVTSGDVTDPTFSGGDLKGAQPSGSMFKLFVLLAVVDAVEQGTLTWDHTLILSDATRSLPSGVLQKEPDGTEVTVEEAALGMISISDNTAADLLIEAVGAAAVDAQITEHAPDGADRTTPLLSTRALFQIGWGDETLRGQWAAADDAGREALLKRVAAAPLTTSVTDVTVPVWEDDLDWFFSAADLARAHLALDQAGDTEAGAPLARILTANPALETADDWDSVAFKGGSSIGVMGGSWLLKDADATYVVVAQSATHSDDEYLAQYSVLYLGMNAAVLLADH
ncbi:serine hydrolase [Plantibacter sp. RU18]|uniref:serine hydrolase n=1 Tax=Plantibacter sp. RU18 TaxID=3158143 RepID=UPI003D365597